MQSVQLENNNNFDINIFTTLIDSIKNFVQKYKLSNIENKLDNIINKFQPLEDSMFVILNENDINKYDNFLEYIEQLEDYLENMKDLELTNSINKKLNNALDLIVLIQFRISGAIADFRLEDKCN